jgi:hypothetical protein
MARSDWSNFPNGMVPELAPEDALLVQDASDTTESDAGTTKGALVSQLTRATAAANAIHGPITIAQYNALTPDPNTMYLIVG